MTAAPISSTCSAPGERWSAELLESHISFPLLSYFRSQHDTRPNSRAGWRAPAVVFTAASVKVGREEGFGATGMHLVERADEAILHFLNSVAGKSTLFDHAVNLISRVHVLKGVVFFSVLWGAWFARSRDDAGTARRDVVLTLLAAAIAAPLSRVLQLVFPVRARPTLNPTLNFSPPIALDPSELHRWGSFPSDHAAIFFAIAAGMWFSFRRLAWLLLAWSILVISLPRLYLGLHYPSDVLGGAALGIGTTLLVRRFTPRSTVDHVLLAEQRWPALFYGSAFMLSYLIATLFDDIRDVGAGLAKYYAG